MAAIYVEQAAPVAVLLTGSAGSGGADFFSDIDLVMYYHELPSDEQLERARIRLAEMAPSPLGPRDSSAVLDTGTVHEIEYQIGHLLVTSVEQDLTRVLNGFDVDSILHKKLIGLREGIPLHGAKLIHDWQRRLDEFPDGLARAMIDHYLGQIFAVWLLRDMLAKRDAVIWQQQLLVEGAQNILGVLAGLNRCYYSTFQFKRMHEFVDRLAIVPERMADRLDELFNVPFVVGAVRVESLVRETIDLVEGRFPDVETSGVRDQINRRQRPWSVPPGSLS